MSKQRILVPLPLFTQVLLPLPWLSVGGRSISKAMCLSTRDGWKGYSWPKFLMAQSEGQRSQRDFARLKQYQCCESRPELSII